MCVCVTERFKLCASWKLVQLCPEKLCTAVPNKMVYGTQKHTHTLTHTLIQRVHIGVFALNFRFSPRADSLVFWFVNVCDFCVHNQFWLCSPSGCWRGLLSGSAHFLLNICRWQCDPHVQQHHWCLRHCPTSQEAKISCFPTPECKTP